MTASTVGTRPANFTVVRTSEEIITPTAVAEGGFNMANPILEQRFLGRITPGMDVCDVGGSKVGSVSEIHRFSELPDPEDTSEMPDEYLEVKTGFFGMGKHFFVPMS